MTHPLGGNSESKCLTTINMAMVKENVIIYLLRKKKKAVWQYITILKFLLNRIIFPQKVVPFLKTFFVVSCLNMATLNPSISALFHPCVMPCVMRGILRKTHFRVCARTQAQCGPARQRTVISIIRLFERAWLALHGTCHCHECRECTELLVCAFSVVSPTLWTTSFLWTTFVVDFLFVSYGLACGLALMFAFPVSQFTVLFQSCKIKN